MHKRIVIGICVILWVCPLLVAAQEGGWAIAGRGGTLGFGAELHRVLVPERLSFRIGATFFRYAMDVSDNGINYHGRLRLSGVPIGIDLHPFKNWFRLQGGLMINLNEVSATAKPMAGLITINGVRYNVAQLGQMEAAVQFNRASPYFGVGFGRPFKKGKHWGFLFDVGAMYHGEARLRLATTLPPSSVLQNDLRQQEQHFQADAREYKLYPLIQFGITYRFGKTGGK
jgi:hypothetical protein